MNGDFFLISPDFSGGGFSGFFPSYSTSGSVSLKTVRDPFLQCLIDPLACNLSVDVWDTAPSVGLPIPTPPIITTEQPPPTLPPITEAQEQPIMDYNDFLGSGGGIDFPSLRPPTSLLDVFGAGLGLAQSLVSSPGAQVPQTIPAPPYTLSTTAVACPAIYTPSGKLRRQHPRKQQIKPRKSPILPCVSNRHMNSLNPKALRRATSRLKGFMGHVHSAQKAIRHALGHTVTPIRRSGAARRGGCYTCGRPARSCVC